MPFTTNGTTRIHWDEMGIGDPLLLIMGHQYSAELWYPVIPILSQHARVIWFDNSGTGQTDSRDGISTIENMALDAFAVLDAAHVATADVYGVSMGGFIALEMAVFHPERIRSLILGATGALTAEKKRPPKLAQLQYFLPWSIYGPLSRRMSYGAARDSEAADFDLEVLKHDTRDPNGLVAQARGIAAYTTTLSAMAAIDRPALVMYGEGDQVIPPAWGQELARTIPGARLVSFPGVGHNYLVGAAEGSNAEVVRFLAAVRG